MQQLTNLIDGERRTSRCRDGIAVENPATEETIALVPTSGPEDVDAAVVAALRAAPAWAARPAAERAALVVHAFERFAADEEIAKIAVAETGHPIRLAELYHMRAPAFWASQLAQVSLTVLEREPVPLRGDAGVSTIQHVPLGVVGIMTPFNSPTLLTAWKAVPALVAGNTIVAKPSEVNPLVIDRLYSAFLAAGIPPGVTNLVHGGVEAAQRLAGHPDLAKLSFTGSTATGARVAEAAGRAITPVVLELGGKSPAVVLEDADLERASHTIAFSAFNLSGQTCSALTRVIVHESVATSLIERLAKLAERLVIGDPTDPATDIGPLVSARQRSYVARMVDEAVLGGARLVTGGEPLSVHGVGHYFRPTVLSDVDNSSDIAQRELFGPVICVTSFTTNDEAIRVANATEFGLAAAVFGEDARETRRVASAINAGTVSINDIGRTTGLTPFGGMKRSGFGRELGVEGVVEYLQPKHLYSANKVDGDQSAYRLLGSQW